MIHLNRYMLPFLIIGFFIPASSSLASVLTLDANGNYVDSQPVKSGDILYGTESSDKSLKTNSEIPFPDPNGEVAINPEQMKNPYSNYQIILNDVALLKEQPAENIVSDDIGGGLIDGFASSDVSEFKTGLVFEPIDSFRSFETEGVEDVMSSDVQAPVELSIISPTPSKSSAGPVSMVANEIQNNSKALVVPSMMSMDMTKIDDIDEDLISPNLGMNTEFDSIIKEEISKFDNVDMAFVKSVMSAESNFNSTAISPKGAMGLMQIMPSTAKTYGVVNPFSPDQNIRAGVAELSRLMTLYKNPTLALAGYNAGETAVEKYNGVPPYSETQEYIVKVLTKTFETRERALEKVTLSNIEERTLKPNAKKEDTLVTRPLTVHSYDW